ncbi:HNH endonuclease (plasmid) [Cytobacillus spongiae]|uniref:HNH endonuclease signature motif containing protein n=1 Tax=Cytobacillus spongiae TaxID=2901381 RepID=UPI001F216124|nr:HNH endonuclease signature motif containing protein [Cytobacillus spongiae]UII58161.1 HNH endonuclease [Cytobacillus spongiae]
MRLEKNLYKKANRYYVNVMRKGVDFSASFLSIEDARHYLSEVRSIQHGAREWQQKGIEYKGQAYIVLSRNEKIHPVNVDLDMVDELMKVNWCITKNGYAYGFLNGKRLFMHQYVMPSEKKGYVVNHINHNKLDNRRENLEVITHQENITKGYQYKKGKLYA